MHRPTLWFLLLTLLVVSAGCDRFLSPFRKPSATGEAPLENNKNRNRLAKEKSPYLLQHADNPVDWYPWGDEAFTKAKKEDKPIFLSIGYYTCHWCHVMEHESFENEEVAAILNEHFVSIKVDREERPDVDEIYMTAVQAMTRHGGWPLTAFLTPELKPFFGGTYFPPEDRYGRPGFKTLLARIIDSWTNKREDVEKNGEQMARHLQQITQTRPGELDRDILDKGQKQIEGNFDETWGGFSPRPKFPRPHNLFFLLRRFADNGDKDLLRKIEKTLEAMADGGIYDHLGGGFHRYSTDEKWLIPHFEKMLYDNALLTRAYLEAYQVTKKERYKTIAQETLEYIRRDMTSKEGAFYAAEDADSEGEEGTFYVWTPDQVETLLGEENGKIFCAFHGVTSKGNFENGTSALHTPNTLEAVAKQFQKDPKELAIQLGDMRTELFVARNERVRPNLDDKIITGWNGLMISAHTTAYRTLHVESYLKIAEKAAQFVLNNLRAKDESLFRRWRAGDARYPAVLDDYAFFIQALLDLYESTLEATWLEEAVRLSDLMIRNLSDKTNGGFFLSEPRPDLLAQSKEAYDGAIPSGNSVAANNLIRLAELTGNTKYQENADNTVKAFSSSIKRHPAGFPQMLLAWDHITSKRREIVIAGQREAPDTKAMLKLIHSQFLPNTVLSWVPEEGPNKELENLLKPTKGKKSKEGKATAYVCQNYACRYPVTTIQELKKQLKESL